MKRAFGEKFGDELYSKEELIAETGAAFLCALAGIANEHTERNTAAYISHWMERLRKEDRLILQAAAAAQKAVDFITGQSFEAAAEHDGQAGKTGTYRRRIPYLHHNFLEMENTTQMMTTASLMRSVPTRPTGRCVPPAVRPGTKTTSTLPLELSTKAFHFVRRFRA